MRVFAPLLDSAASTRNLVLVVVHASFATGAYALFYYDVPRPVAVWEWVATWLINAGVLAAALGLVTVCARFVVAGWRRWLPPVTGHRWWVVVGAAAVAFVSVGAWLDQGGGLLWIVGCIFVATLVTLLLLRLAPWRTLDDGHVLPDATAGAWSAICIAEVLFHTFGGSFFRWEAIGGLMTAMSHEVVAFIFGPAAWVTILIAGGYLGTAAALCVAFRRRPVPDVAGATGRRVVLIGLVFVGGMCLWSDPGDRLRRVHHVHPTVADLAGLFAPPLPVAAVSAVAGQSPDLLPGSGEVSGPVASQKPSPPAQNLIIIYVDTVSRRHLNAYGYDRNVAPNVLALARQSRRFTRARTNASHTDLATVALFYGIFPFLHTGKEDDYSAGHGGRPLHLLAKDGGLKVGIFSGDWEQSSRGYAPLFPEACDRFMDAHTAGEESEIQEWAGLREDHVVDAFLDWYAPLHDRGERFFAYVKFIRPHSPYYTPPEWTGPFAPAADGWTFFDYHPSPERVRLLRNRYDNAVYWVDVQIGRIVAHLKQTGAWEDTAIVFLSDHGEAWGEHVLYNHAMQHFEEFVEIPLLIRVPGDPAGDDVRQVSAVDVAPTGLALLGLPPAPFHQGHTLTDLTYEPDRWFATSNIVASLVTIQEGPWKYTRDLYTGEQWLFHMEQDPAERHNVAWSSSETPRMRRILDGFLARQLAQMEALRSSP